MENINPVRVLEVYLVNGWPHGYEITHKSYPASLHGYTSTFNFSGKRAHIVIVSNDGNVDRSIALCFAEAFVLGKTRTRRIDLSPLSRVADDKGKR